MSKVAKGIGKAVSGFVGGVKKVFKKVVSSKLGRIILIAAAVYYGGAAFDMWTMNAGMPGATAVNNMGANYAAGNGMFNSAAMASEGLAGEVVANAGAETALAQASSSGIPGEAQAVMANSSTVPSAAVPVTPQHTGAGSLGWDGTGGTTGNMVEPLSAKTSVAAPSATPTADPAFKAGAGQGWADAETLGGVKKAVEPNIIKRLLGGTADWIGENPWPAVIGLNAASSLLNDEQGDAWDREDKERARRNKNLEGVAGVNLGMSPSGKPLTYSDGSPVYSGGLVGSNMSRG
jgi:hypothetical protein